MTKSTLLAGAAIGGAAMALAAAQNKPVTMAEDTGPKFEAPEPPEEGATFPTVHGHLADVVRTVVANDDAVFTADFNKGVIYPPEARAATEVMRGALRMYEVAAGAAASAPVPAMLRQAIVKLDKALQQTGFTEGTHGASWFKEVRTLVESGMLALDFQPPPAPNLLQAAKDLRAAQTAYMADRGNDALGQAVANAAAMLDFAIAQAGPE